jgi:hypothetical protein
MTYVDINNDPRPPLPKACEYCGSEGRYRPPAQETLCDECYGDWLICQRKGTEKTTP